jgi:hypothetical protein
MSQRKAKTPRAGIIGFCRPNSVPIVHQCSQAFLLVIVLLIMKDALVRRTSSRACPGQAAIRRSTMKRLIQSVVVAAACACAALLLGHGTEVSAAQKQHKVYICHGTASAKNPYVLINVDESAVKGHLDGTGPGHGPRNYPDFLAVNGSCNISPPSGGS